MIRVVFIDADDNTPVLDIKPYTPSFDRVETPVFPHGAANGRKAQKHPEVLIGDRCLTFKGAAYEITGLSSE